MHYILGNLFISTSLVVNAAFILRLYLSYKKDFKIAVFNYKAAVFTLILLSFLTLVSAYINSDFEILNVYLNSYSEKPLFYKISGSWGNHEGSLLLFILLLSLCNLMFFNNAGSKLKPLLSLYNFLIIEVFLLFLYLSSNPFELNNLIVNNGLGLNPVLQDFALAIHPPILYFGYVMTALFYSYILTLLQTGEFNKANIKKIESLVNLCFIILTLGIGLGSWWAYRELGWGGYWFWDPVENLALLVWLFVTTLLHLVIVNKHNSKLQNWLIFFGLTGFLFVILSFFMVRSGILTSVHSFSADPHRGVFLLLIFIAFTVLAACVVIHKIKPVKASKFILNRLGLIELNNFLFAALIIVVGFGTIYPIFATVFLKQNVFIGAPFFNKTILPIILLMLFFMSLLPRSNWVGKLRLVKSQAYIIILALIIAVALYFVGVDIINVGLVAFSLLLIIATIKEFYFFYKHKKLKPNFLRVHVGHLGFAVFILAIALNNISRFETERVMRVGEVFLHKNISLEFLGMDEGEMGNYYYVRNNFKLTIDGKEGKLYPEKRYYKASKITTKETQIKRLFFHDIYLVVGEIYNQDRLKIRFIYNPYINLLWLGSLLLILQFVFRREK